MSVQTRLARQSTFTGLAVLLFAGGLTLLFVVLYHEPMRRGPLMIAAGVLLIATIACWIASARSGAGPDGR